MASAFVAALKGIVRAHPVVALGVACLSFAALLRLRRRKRLRPVGGLVVVVTGASSGIGEGICTHLARRRAHVVLAARRIDKLEEVASTLRLCGAASTLSVQCDIVNEDDRKKLIAQTMERYGRLDILVLNAGKGAILDFDDSIEVFNIFRDVMELNLFANIRLLQHALGLLTASKGTVCFISSLSAIINSHYTAYGASKHAVSGLCGALRGELRAKFGVRVAVVFPGFIHTEFHRNVQSNTNVPKSKPHQMMEADECARQIVDSLERGDEELIMTFGGKFGYMARPFFPKIIDTMVRKESLASVGLGRDTQWTDWLYAIAGVEH